ERGFRVAAETQGSFWRSWLAQLDRLTVSPKPPSSRMATAANRDKLVRFLGHLDDSHASRSVLKIVCFAEVDLDWARSLAAEYPQLPLYLSADTPVPAPERLRDAVGQRYRWLCERVAREPDLARARVLPQLHVIAWEAQ